MSGADAIEAAARALRPGMSVDQAARAAYAAIAPIVRQDVAEEIGTAEDPNALMRVLETVARSLGWECESDRMGGVDGEASFEFYVWRAK